MTFKNLIKMLIVESVLGTAGRETNKGEAIIIGTKEKINKNKNNV